MGMVSINIWTRSGRYYKISEYHKTKYARMFYDAIIYERQKRTRSRANKK